MATSGAIRKPAAVTLASRDQLFTEPCLTTAGTRENVLT